MSSINGMGYYIAQEAFFELERSFGDLSGRQTYTMIYAYFENAVAHAKQIKKLSTWDGQNIGPEKKNKIAEEKTPTIDNPQPDIQEPTQQEEQLNKQDQCPPGYYFSEEIGDCVLEDIDIEEESQVKNP